MRAFPSLSVPVAPKALSLAGGRYGIALVACLVLTGCRHSSRPTQYAAKNFRVREVGEAIQGGGWNMFGNGYLGEYFVMPKAGSLQLRLSAAGDPAAGVYPLARLWVNDHMVSEFSVDSSNFRDYNFSTPVNAGNVTVELQFVNDSAPNAPQDRNLRVLGMDVSPAVLAHPIPDSVAVNIARYRMGTLLVHTRPGARVQVTQLAHEFPFGTCLTDAMFGPRPADAKWTEADRAKYQQIAATYFNAATTENSLKWPHTDPKRGVVSYADADSVVDWARQHGMSVRGHCLFWAVDSEVPDWVKGLFDSELQSAIEKRARDVMTHYRGKIDEFDVNNEMLHGDYYGRRLGEPINAEMFELAKIANPAATLYVNDYDILTGDKTNDYLDQIKTLQAAGAPVGGIGLQAHFDGGIDVRQVRRTLKTFGKLNLPVKITEFDLKTKDEALKARQLRDFYRTCFANPNVAGITMWGFWEGSQWVPEAALFKKDWTPTPAARAYHDLVYKEWWTDASVKANQHGVARIPAFFGRYSVQSEGKQLGVSLLKSQMIAPVNLVP